MSDPSLKQTAGKPALHLIPWLEFNTTDSTISWEYMYEALKQWWCGRPFSLHNITIPKRELEGIGQALEFGARKYVPRGWEKGIPFSQVFAAACRHAEALGRGERLASDSGLPHEAHFWCNVLFIVVFQARGREDLDDRPEPVPAVRALIESFEQRRDAAKTMVDALRWPTPKGSN